MHQPNSPATSGIALPTRLRNLSSSFATTMGNISNHDRCCSLPPGYIPGDRDVICGRGKKNWGHPGNVQFRNIIRCNVPLYVNAPSKSNKSMVVVRLVDEIRRLGGNFLKEDMYGRWYDIGDVLARDKVGHSLRDQVSAMNRTDKNQLEQPKSTDSAAGSSMRMSWGVSKSDSQAARNLHDVGEVDEAISKKIGGCPGSPEEQAAVITYDEQHEQDSFTYPQNSLPLASGIEHRWSSLSDSSAEISERRNKIRSSFFSSSLMRSLERRPSFLALSYESRDSMRRRGISLVGGDVQSSLELESFRRSTNWDFLDDLEGDAMDVDLEKYDLDRSAHGVQIEDDSQLYNFRNSDVQDFARI